MTQEEALLILGECYRHSLTDYTFGDTELDWTLDKQGEDKPIANCYIGRVGMAEVSMYDGTVLLLERHIASSLGKFGSSASNSEG